MERDACLHKYCSELCISDLQECKETIRSYRREWANSDCYQGLNISQRGVMMILPSPSKHMLVRYAATRHGFWLWELFIWPETGKLITALVVLRLTQSNWLRHCTVELCALTTGTTVSRWATAMIDNNLDGMMDVKTQEVRAARFKQWSSWILSAHEEEVLGRHALTAFVTFTGRHLNRSLSPLAEIASS